MVIVTSRGSLAGLDAAMQLVTFLRLQAADAARRLDTFEQELQRRRIVQEHESAALARRIANWDAVEGESPYRSRLVH